jgi:hypothetical protein
MPAQTSSSLAARLGAKMAQAHAQHQNDDIKTDDDLPPGIERGIAELDKIYFGTFQTGDTGGADVFYLSGIAVSPKSIVDPVTKQVIKVEGSRVVPGWIGKTSARIPIPLCDTKKYDGSPVSFDEHWAQFLDYVRMLGVDTKQLPPESVEATVAALQQMADQGKLHFEFRTWIGTATEQYPNPKVNVVFRRKIDFDPNQVVDQVDDQTAVPTALPSSPPPKAQTAQPPITPPVQTAVAAPAQPPDLDALAVKADPPTQDAMAANTLQDLAKSLGVDQDLINKASSWVQVVQYIRAKQGPVETEETEEEEVEEVETENPFRPVIGKVYNWMDAKVGKQIPVVCEEITDADQTVKIADQSNMKRKIKGVKFEKLLPV